MREREERGKSEGTEQITLYTLAPGGCALGCIRRVGSPSRGDSVGGPKPLKLLIGFGLPEVPPIVKDDDLDTVRAFDYQAHLAADIVEGGRPDVALRLISQALKVPLEVRAGPSVRVRLLRGGRWCCCGFRVGRKCCGFWGMIIGLGSFPWAGCRGSGVPAGRRHGVSARRATSVSLPVGDLG